MFHNEALFTAFKHIKVLKYKCKIRNAWYILDLWQLFLPFLFIFGSRKSLSLFLWNVEEITWLQLGKSDLSSFCWFTLHNSIQLHVKKIHREKVYGSASEGFVIIRKKYYYNLIFIMYLIFRSTVFDVRNIVFFKEEKTGL